MLAIATTHTQARYVLPPVLSKFAARFPKVRLVLHQGNPMQVAEQTLAGDVDVGIATEALGDSPQLVTLPCYRWNRGVLVPKGHPLAKVRPLTLEAVAGYPIVTYDFAFTGRSAINAAFTARGLEPNVVLTALDADVIKTYVELGMGVGIVAQWRSTPRRTSGSRCSTRAICSRRRRRGSRCATASSCADTFTSSSRCSRRSTRAAPSTPRWPATCRWTCCDSQ